MDYQGIPDDILDEIALEGLDGITISSLWSRLSCRKGFSIALDNYSKKYIWSLICKNESIQMFLLREPRPPLDNYNRYDYVDQEFEVICEPEELPEDIYPVAPIDENGVRGSCSTFKTRKNISDEAKLMPLEEVLSMHEEKLVLVASQAARNTALAGIHAESLGSLVINSYMVLERIGRSREHGEVTQGKQGLSRLNIPCKSAFYFRKRLLADGLIVKQPMSMKVSNRMTLGTLLHLPRFYSLKQSKLIIMMKKLVQVLKDAPPPHMLDYPTIRAQLNTTVKLKKILATSEIKQHVEIESVPYRTIHPDATIAEWKMRHSDNEKSIKVMRLVNPALDPEDIFAEDEKPNEDASESDDEERDNVSTGILTNAIVQRHHHSIIRQVYTLVEAAGPEGLSQNDVVMQLGLAQLDARSVLRALLRLQMAERITKDIEKSRVFVYVVRKHFNANELRVRLEEEQQKVIGMIQSGGHAVQDPSSRASTPNATNIQLEKDVSLREEQIKEDDGLFRPSVHRGILQEGETISDLTQRSLKRISIILGAIRKFSVMDDMSVILRMIQEEEAKEGINTRMDRRSLRRLVSRLANEGQLVQKRIILRTDGGMEKTLNFLCQPGVDQSNSVIRSAIEQAKMKLFCIPRPKMIRQAVKPEKVKPEKIDFGKKTKELVDIVTNSVKEAKEQLALQKDVVPTKIAYLAGIGRAHGHEPKCIRVKELHHMLFYLIYGYTGQGDADQNEMKHLLKRRYPTLDDSMLSDIPAIYQPEVSWKMFLDKLPVHSGWSDGWCFLCDILLRLPLSLFVKVVNVNRHVDKLEEFLKHPIKQHLLLKHLPMDLRQGLIYGRKYIFSVFEVVTNMVYLGLAQLGPHSVKEKDQAFIYLNRKTSILDTTISAPGYHHISRDLVYEKIDYYFDSMTDLNKYWYDLYHTCSNTLLGSVSTVAGQSITLEMLRKKPPMIEAMRIRETAEEARELDNGEIPGDHLGAAGFDSAFFAHLKRNWTYNKTTLMTNRLESNKIAIVNEKSSKHSSDSVATSGRLRALRSNAIRFAVPQTNTNQGENLAIPVTLEPNVPHTSKGQKRKRTTGEDASKPSVGFLKIPTYLRRGSKAPVSKVRIVKARKTCGPRRPYYDEKDRLALLQMRRLRVTWSPIEDSFLLMCKVAGVYLYGNMRQNVSTREIRDCLHESFKEASNKTSRACQRRIAYMMRNPITYYQVENAYEELKQDPHIVTISGGGPISKQDRAKGIENTEKLANARFRLLLEHLKPRYNSSQGGNTTALPGLDLPTTLEEFHRKYRLKFSHTGLRHHRPISEVTNREEIRSAAIFNVVHSDLCRTEDKTSFAHHLFNVYNQYPDSLIRETVQKMQKDMTIAHHKRHKSREKTKNTELPVKAGLFKLSISYIHLFRSRYQYSVFHLAYQNLKNLLEQKQKTDKPNDWRGLEVSRIHEGGSAALTVTLFALGVAKFHYQIPEQIIIFDPKLKDHPKEFDNLIKRYNNWMKDVDRSAATKTKDGQRDQRRNSQTAAAAINAPSVISKLMTIPLNENSGLVSSASENQEDVEMADPSASGAERQSKQLIVRTVSRISLHMLREDLSRDGKSFTGTATPHIQQEHFVINSCKVSVDVDTKDNQNWFFLSPQCKQEILDSIPVVIPCSELPSQAECWELYDLNGLDGSAKAEAVRILQLIDSKKEMGILVSDLPQEVGELQSSCTLERHMNLLIESKIVLRVGVVAARLVSFDHVYPWLVQSFRLSRKGKEKLDPLNAVFSERQEEVEVEQPLEDVDPLALTDSPDESTTGLRRTTRRRIHQVTPQSAKKPKTVDGLGPEDRVELLIFMKPWIKIDGKLNRRVLDRLLGAVLSHVMLKPGCTIFHLTQRFHPAIQPLQIRELVEILTKINCVSLYCLKKTGRPGLFTPRTTVEIAEFSPFAPDKDVYCDPKVDALLRLGEFIGDKKYEKDYIPKCSCHNLIDP